MTTRDIADTLQELYGTEVSPALVAKVTDAVWDTVQTWQSRPLETVYPILYLDGLVIKVHQDNRVINKTMHVALGVNLAGHKEVLGSVASRNGGCQVLAVGADGTAKSRAEGRVRHLRGRFDRLFRPFDGSSARPGTTVYRASGATPCATSPTRTVGGGGRHEADLPSGHPRRSRTGARDPLAERWDGKYPALSRLWSRHWEHVITAFDYPRHPAGHLHDQRHRVAQQRDSARPSTTAAFSPDRSALKVVYLAVEQAAKKWTMPVQNWKQALNRFAIQFEGRLPL